MIEKEYIKELAHELMFDLSEEEVVEIQKEYETFSKQLELLEKIDTKDVKPMPYPFENETNYLREDVVTHVITQEDALRNTSYSKEGHFVVHKVVK